MPKLDATEINGYIDLATRLFGLGDTLLARLKAAGVSDEQLAAITSDYDARIAARAADLPPAA